MRTLRVRVRWWTWQVRRTAVAPAGTGTQRRFHWRVHSESGLQLCAASRAASRLWRGSCLSAQSRSLHRWASNGPAAQSGSLHCRAPRPVGARLGWRPRHGRRPGSRADCRSVRCPWATRTRPGRTPALRCRSSPSPRGRRPNVVLDDALSVAYASRARAPLTGAKLADVEGPSAFRYRLACLDATGNCNHFHIQTRPGFDAMVTGLPVDPGSVRRPGPQVQPGLCWTEPDEPRRGRAEER